MNRETTILSAHSWFTNFHQFCQYSCHSKYIGFDFLNVKIEFYRFFGDCTNWSSFLQPPSVLLVHLPNPVLTTSFSELSWVFLLLVFLFEGNFFSYHQFLRHFVLDLNVTQPSALGLWSRYQNR